jgi:hypothetical protein
VTSWPGINNRQVLVPTWQQLPGLSGGLSGGLSSQRPVQQHIIPEALTSQQIPEPLRRSLLVDNLDHQGQPMFPMVSTEALSAELENILSAELEKQLNNYCSDSL